MDVEIDLRPVWSALLDVYKEIETICKRHNLRYWAAWGTLLGAVRHNGFIPWDDDLDLMMPQEDYESFMRFAEHELPDYMKPVTIFNTKEYHWGFGKIQDCRKEVLERLENEAGYVSPDGIYVDIFPMSGCLTSSTRRFFRRINSFFLKCRQHYLFVPNANPIVKFVGSMAGMLYPSLKSSRDFKLNDIKRLSAPMFNDTDRCAFLRDEISRKVDYVSIPLMCFKDTLINKFEDVTIPIPSGYDEYLRRCYGEYMQLPPLEKRIMPSHSIDEIVPWRLGPTGV